jgi:hypothetical protein
MAAVAVRRGHTLRAADTVGRRDAGGRYAAAMALITDLKDEEITTVWPRIAELTDAQPDDDATDADDDATDSDSDADDDATDTDDDTTDS